MTARRRTIRAPRAPRRAPSGRPAVVRVPPAGVRRERGPRPPDDVIAALERALRAELPPLHQDGARQDAEFIAGAVRLGRRWATAVARAARAITVRARRGVVGALGGAARVAPVSTPSDWAARTTAAVEASVTASVSGTVGPSVALERAVNVAAAEVLAEHARQVQALAVAAGSPGYIWGTQRDEKVRAGHAALEGTPQRWDVPPITDPATGYRAHPGEPRNCRCQAWPLPPGGSTSLGRAA